MNVSRQFIFNRFNWRVAAGKVLKVSFRMALVKSAPWKGIAAVALVLAVLLICAFGIDRRSEGERVEAETASAVRKIQILNSGRIKQSPVFAAELILRSALGQKDARNHYMEQFDLGMNRLVELGILEKRAFVISDTNGYSLFIRNCVSGVTPSPDLLWRVSSKTGGVDVVAKPAEMPKWEAAIKLYATNPVAVETGTNLPSHRFSPVAQ